MTAMHETNEDASAKLPGYIKQLDNSMHKEGYKRTRLIIRHGDLADSFTRNVFFVVLTAYACRIPRILNPLHKRKNKIRVQ